MLAGSTFAAFEAAVVAFVGCSVWLWVLVVAVPLWAYLPSSFPLATQAVEALQSLCVQALVPDLVFEVT